MYKIITAHGTFTACDLDRALIIAAAYGMRVVITEA